MKSECVSLLDATITELSRKKLKSTNEYLRSEKFPSLTEEIHGVQQTIQPTLFYPEAHKSKNRLIGDYELNAITSNSIRPCFVNLLPLDPIAYEFYKAHITENSTQKICQSRKSFEFSNQKKKESLMPVLPTSSALKDNLSITSDFIKASKSCSVVLEEIGVKDYSNNLEMNAPTCPTSRSVKRSSENIYEIETSQHSYNVLTPCFVKLERLDSKLLSEFINGKGKKVGYLDGADTEEKLERTMCLKEGSVVSSLTFKERKQDSTQHDKLNETTKLKASKDATNKESLKFPLDSNEQVKDFQIAFQPCSSLSDFKNKFKNGLRSSSFKISNLGTTENLPCETSSCEELNLLSESKKNNGSVSDEQLKLVPNDVLAAKDLQIGNEQFSSSSAVQIKYKGAFKSSETLRNESVFHLANNASAHHCFQCKKALPSLKSFYYHVCLGKQKRGFLCRFCEKNFDFYHSLQKHKKTHALKNSLSCSERVKSRHVRKVHSTSAKIGGADKNMKKSPGEKENNSSPNLRAKRIKSVVLQNISDATTSSGYYSSNYFHIPCPDDSEID